jgi:hypothetical protein
MIADDNGVVEEGESAVLEHLGGEQQWHGTDVGSADPVRTSVDITYMDEMH